MAGLSVPGQGRARLSDQTLHSGERSQEPARAVKSPPFGAGLVTRWVATPAGAMLGVRLGRSLPASASTGQIGSECRAGIIRPRAQWIRPAGLWARGSQQGLGMDVVGLLLTAQC